jgi:hypothetical protein
MASLVPVELSDEEKNNKALVRSLEDAYLRGAQLSVFYRLVPSTDIHLIRFGSTFTVHIGVSAFQKAADRYAALHNISFHAYYEVMGAEDLRKRLGEKRYTPAAVGAICYIWRSDKAEAYKIFGGDDPKSAMTKGYGHWSDRARWNKYKNTWEEDTVPSQRTPADVARRRALLAALKAEFSLDSLLAAAPNEVREQLEWLDKDATRAVQDQQPMQPVRLAVTPDGFVEEDGNPWGDEPIQENEDVDYYGAEEGEFREAEPEPASVTQYRLIADELTGSAYTLMEWSRQYHADSQGEADLVPYRILSGELDKIVGKQNHNLLLGVLLGREVHSGNRPGEKFVRFLLHFIQKDLPQRDAEGNTVKNDKGRVLKNENPGYREQFVEAIKDTWEQITSLSNSDS